MDSDSALSSTIIFAVSLVCFFLASLAQTSISSVRRERVQRLSNEGVAGSGMLGRLQSLPMGPASSLSLLMYASFTASLLSAVVLAISQAGMSWGPISLVAAAVLLILGLLYSLARAVAMSRGEQIALRCALPTRMLAWLFNPLLAVGDLIARRVLGIGKGYTNGSSETTPPDMGLPLESVGEPLDEHEVRMIRGVVQLDETVAREIMVPRVDMVVAEIGSPIGQLADLMVNTSHSRIPVYRDNLDRIEGIAYARDIIRHLVQDDVSQDMLVESIIRPALFIPESKTLEELLSEFQQRRVHMAIVVDEYGGVSGLVTIEDLLEEIVGEIMDEFDVSEPDIEAVSDTEYMMDARVSLDIIKNMLNVQVEGNGFDTIGGFVYHHLGKMPSPGDCVEYDGLMIEVVSTAGRRLKRLRVTKKTAETSEIPSK